MIARVFSLFSILFLAAFVSGCGGGASLGKLPQTTATEYTLDAGDQVQIQVFGETRLTGTYAVGDNGQISVPLLGSVPARGLTVVQLGQNISSDLQRKGLVLNPSVSVQVAEFRPFFILGEVAKPGSYPFVEGMTVLTAVAIGGGFTFRAQRDYVSVTRTINGKSAEYRASRDSKILPGDVINVFERYI